LRINRPELFPRITLLAAPLLAFVCAGTDARAQETDPTVAATATELFTHGRDAVQKKDFRTACPLFAESARLDPKVGTLLNLADCEEHLSHLVAARQYWHRAIEIGEKTSDTRIALARERYAAVDARVPRLAISKPPSSVGGIVIKRDGFELGAAALGTSLPVDPGEHVIRVTAPGHAPSSVTVSVAEKERKEIVATLGAATHDDATVTDPFPSMPDPTPPPAEEPTGQTAHSGSGDSGDRPRPPSAETSSSTQRWIGYAVGVAGLVGLGVGAVFGLEAKSKNDASNAGHCDSTGCDPEGFATRNDAISSARVSTVAFVVGAGMLAGGAALVLTAPSTPQAAAPQAGGPSGKAGRGSGVTVAATATADTTGARLWLRGSF
jgi:hypothetical protein